MGHTRLAICLLSAHGADPSIKVKREAHTEDRLVFLRSVLDGVVKISNVEQVMDILRLITKDKIFDSTYLGRQPERKHRA